MRTCFRHPDRPAIKEGNVPCAPGGKLPLCQECADPKNAAYLAIHHKEVKVFKAGGPTSN